MFFLFSIQSVSFSRINILFKQKLVFLNVHIFMQIFFFNKFKVPLNVIFSKRLDWKGKIGLFLLIDFFGAKLIRLLCCRCVEISYLKRAFKQIWTCLTSFNLFTGSILVLGSSKFWPQPQLPQKWRLHQKWSKETSK